MVGGVVLAAALLATTLGHGNLLSDQMGFRVRTRLTSQLRVMRAGVCIQSLMPVRVVESVDAVGVVRY